MSLIGTLNCTGWFGSDEVVGARQSFAMCITLCIYIVRYEWDAAKNRSNQRKHDGISFELATLVFEDEQCLVYVDRVDEHTGEQRWIALGTAQPASDAILLVVAHVYREDEHGEEIIRIISARQA